MFSLFSFVFKNKKQFSKTVNKEALQLPQQSNPVSNYSNQANDWQLPTSPQIMWIICLIMSTILKYYLPTCQMKFIKKGNLQAIKNLPKPNFAYFLRKYFSNTTLKKKKKKKQDREQKVYLQMCLLKNLFVDQIMRSKSVGASKFLPIIPLLVRPSSKKGKAFKFHFYQ